MEPETNCSTDDDIVLLSARKVSQSLDKKEIQSGQPDDAVASATEQLDAEAAQGEKESLTLDNQSHNVSQTSPTILNDCHSVLQLRSMRAHSLPPLRVASPAQCTSHSNSERRRSLSTLGNIYLPALEPGRSNEAGPSTPPIYKNGTRLAAEAHIVKDLDTVEETRLPLADTADLNQELIKWAQMPPTPPQRNLRTRKPAQLAPYTTEWQVYTRRMVRNDWEDAVVKERGYLRAQREKRREREGLSAEADVLDQNQSNGNHEARRRRTGKERRLEAEIALEEEDGYGATSSSGNHRPEQSRIAEDIMRRFGGPLSSSSDDEEQQHAQLDHPRLIRSSRASPPNSAFSSSQGARVQSRKRHRNALISESETSTPEIVEISDISLIESDAHDTNDATSVSREGITTQNDRLSPSRDEYGYTIEERKTYERHFKYLKRLMPIRQAREHAADVITMQREKEAGTREHEDHQPDVHSRETSTGSLRPGETRTRITHQRDWASSRLIDDADEESDDSQIPSPESSLQGSSSSESDDEVVEDRREPIDYWPQTMYKRKRDNIDRMLTSAVIKTLKRKSINSGYKQSRFVSTGVKEKISAVVMSSDGQQRKKKRVDRGIATHSIRQSNFILYDNPAIINVKYRSRYSLFEDNALFDAFTVEFAKVRERKEISAVEVHQLSTSTLRNRNQQSIESNLGKENERQSIQYRGVQAFANAMSLVERGNDNRMFIGSRLSPISIDATTKVTIEKTPLMQKQLKIDDNKKKMTISPQMEKQRADMDIWRNVCDLRLTFGLHPPRSGTRFSSETYLGKGRLYELIQLAKGSHRQYDEWSLYVFGCEASLSSSTTELKESLYAAEEEMRLVLQLNDDEEDRQSTQQFIQSLSDLLRLLVIKSNLTCEDDVNMSDFLYNSLQHLLTIIKTWKGNRNAIYQEMLLLLRWYKVELSWRRIQLFGSIARLEKGGLDWQFIFPEACQELILELLIYGLNRTMREMNKDDVMETNNELKSVSAQYWIGLIHLLSLEECKTTLHSYCSFWSLFEASLKQYHAVLESKMNSLIIAENGWYCLLSICSLSYYTASAGNATSHSCLSSGHWSLITEMISKIRLRANVQVESSMSRLSLETRDEYIRMVLCRIYNLHSTWEWSFESSETALSKVYCLFDSHKLNDLPTESHHDFASFLRHYDESLLMEPIQSSDKCFDIFIKILARAASNLQSKSNEDTIQGNRSIARLFSRFSPMRALTFSKDVPPTNIERSGLYNHYSIALLYLYHVPTSRQQRLLQIQGYLSFIKADEKSRLACIRAMMYAMIVLQHHQLDIKECINWFKNTFKLLVTKLEELHRLGATLGQQYKWQRQVKMYRDLLLVTLRSIQYVIKTLSLKRDEIKKEYPNMALIDTTWISSLMQSQLVIEGVEVATEVCKTLQTFIDCRSNAMMSLNTKVTTTVITTSGMNTVNEESQDSCTDLFDDVDFDDALLLDALELAEKKPINDQMNKERQQIRQMDLEFAHYLHSFISPSLFQLLSNLFHPERQSKFSLSRINLLQQSTLTNGILQMLPSLVQNHDKTTLAELLIDIWSRCAWIMVEDNNIRQWNTYFNYGQEDPKRLQGDVAKRDITLRFLVGISTKYLEVTGTSPISLSDLYGDNITEFWITFLSSLVAPRLSFQHVLCNNLKQLELKRDDLYGGLFQHMDWEGKEAWTLEDVEKNRLQLLGVILRNFNSAIIDNRNDKSIRSLAFASLTALLVSMRIYITALGSLERKEYLDFGNKVLQICRHEELSESLERGITFELNKTSAAISSYSLS